MDIQFFGSSVCITSDNQETFIDMVCNHYGIDVKGSTSKFYTGVPKCSEERILFYLKKIDKPDVAVIFHAHPNNVFFPSWFRDLWNASIERNQLDHWSKTNLQLQMIVDLRYMTSMNSVAIDDDYYWHNMERSSINYQEFFNHDLQRNRFYGALIQIDQYVKAKGIHAIHLPYPKTIPSWFEFTSGVVDHELGSFQHKVEHNCSYRETPNAVNPDSNRVMADKLIGYIDAMLCDR